MDIASMELATARLAGLERLALRRLALLTATTRDTALVELAFATPSTPDATAAFSSAPTPAPVPELAST